MPAFVIGREGFARGRKRLIGIMAVLAGIIPVAAAADSLWITGNYGNAAGCRYASSGQIEGDNYILLKSNSIERYESQCEILNVNSSGGGWAVLDVICGGEGETWAEKYLFQEDIEDRNKAKLAIASAPEFETLERCN
jgi:hypothetical protein